MISDAFDLAYSTTPQTAPPCPPAKLWSAATEGTYLRIPALNGGLLDMVCGAIRFGAGIIRKSKLSSTLSARTGGGAGAVMLDESLTKIKHGGGSWEGWLAR
jgi:hypothetical protein